MTNVLVGTNNQIKVQATKDAFKKYFSTIKVKRVNFPDTGQPMSFAEICANARKRAKLSYKDGCISVGIEAGIFKSKVSSTGYLNTCVCYIYNGNKFYFGQGPEFEIPLWIVKKIKKEKCALGDVIDIICRRKNAREHLGAIGVLSKGVVKRKQIVYLAVLMALISMIQDTIAR